tara:strand:+ start:4 stop:3486 length:3483 start_codon:yes stop_codon:yes gene_type:complete
MLLLEKLQKKPVPKDIEKPVAIKLGSEQVEVQIELEDQSKTSNFDVALLKERIKRKGLTAPVIETKVQPTDDETKEEPQKVDITVTRPKKLKSTVKLPGKKRPKKQKQSESVVLSVPPESIIYQDNPLEERLPSKSPNVLIKAPAYYLNNREIFVNFINSLFQPYKQEIEDEGSKLTCESLKQKKSKDFSLMTHQKLVRDYMNLYTPYRGILLFHGLGAGKTCGSIAIAEGMKSDKQVFVLTPASLKTNYFEELKVCGDPLYKKNQYWEKINPEGNRHLAQAISEILNLDFDDVFSRGAWFVNTKKPSNFDKLDPEQQKEIDKQLDNMIQKKYKFISYNGIRQARLNAMIQKSKETQQTPNPFDNSVIIIDEAHNFVSRIVNKIKKRKTKQSFEELPLSLQLYELILSANNARVVFLTGTPMINYPNEIAILFNMLRGYIKTFTFLIDTSETTLSKVNQNAIKDLLSKNKILDYIEYKSSTRQLVVTRNPFGFTNKKRRKKGVINYAGISNNPPYLRDDNFFKRKIVKLLKEENIKTVGEVSITNYKSLPDTFDDFIQFFVDPINSQLKETDIFKRRILGLTSYFRSASESLLPRYSETPEHLHIEKINMSNYQIGIYESARTAERNEEKRNAKKSKRNANLGIYADTTSTYRIFSRAFCNFVFPNEIDEEEEIMINRPMPRDGTTIEDAISSKKKKKKDDDGSGEKKQAPVTEEVFDAIPIEQQLQNIDGLNQREDVENIKKVEQQKTDNSYRERIEKALQLLYKNRRKYLSPKGLEIYSPKFLKVLQNITSHNNPGLHLVYSQFRTIEGIGVLSLVLEANGFRRFRLTKNNGIWDIPPMTPEEAGKPTFALYTGTESSEEKEIIRNVFNSDWKKLPSTLATKLKQMNNNNHMGEIVKILMITSSGSEGITLKNTRFVHIIEPYWHPVRTDQVIGRARRICSHQDLPEEYKTVEVFLYLMTFSEEQLNGVINSETKEKGKAIVSDSTKLSKGDRSKEDKSKVFTSDETLFEISMRKKRISNSILKAIKETSIDCSVYSTANAREGIACYSFGSPSNNTFTGGPSYGSQEKQSVRKANVKRKTWRGIAVNVGPPYGVVAIKRTIKNPKNKLEKRVGEAYSLSSYEAAQKNPNLNPTLVGRTQINPENGKFQFIPIESELF